jgi:putative heme-binding domain-containing protein
LFRKHCATCHKLFDEGEAIGPDLTHANRKDRDYLLVSIVDPSAGKPAQAVETAGAAGPVQLPAK